MAVLNYYERASEPWLQARWPGSVLNVAVLSGALEIADFFENRRKYYRVLWCGDGFPWVDPLKEVNAEKAAIRSRLKSRAESIAEKGRDIEDVDSEIEEDNRRAGAKSILLDSSPDQRQRKNTDAL